MDIDLPNSLKRCLSAPIINNLQPNTIGNVNIPSPSSSSSTSTTKVIITQPQQQEQPLTTTDQYLLNQQIQRKVLNSLLTESANKMTSKSIIQVSSNCSSPQRPQSREASPAPILNIFAPRARRYSASFAPLAGAVGINNGASCNGPRLTPRVSQLRQEECIDMNSREVNHEREVHSAIQISQSWEDLTLVAENWSCKSEDMSNPLQVTLPPVNGFNNNCSSPSPTSRGAGMRLPYGLSPSPTRRTFATRRSMSPIAMRPSQLGPVKRKFELDDSTWNSYSPPPFKKIFTESRGSSPICQSPDSGTYDGRITPKFLSKLCTTSTSATNSASSMCSSPGSMIDSGLDIQSNTSSTNTNNNILPLSSSSSSSSSSASSLTNDKIEIMNIVCNNTESETLNCINDTNLSDDKQKEIIQQNNLHNNNIKSEKNKQINEDTLMLDEEKISSNFNNRIIQQNVNKLQQNWKESVRQQQDIISDSSESCSSTTSSCFGVNKNNFSNLKELSKENSSGMINNKIDKDCNLIVGGIVKTIDNNPT